MAKRLFDIFFSIFALLLVGWIILLSWFLATLDTKQNGFFFQKRVGQYGKHFTIVKLRTMKVGSDNLPHISRLGAFFRAAKIDEFPQFFNVLFGTMSVVGPRPDVEGYYDCLKGEERKILELKPGLTNEASLKYYNEEKILAAMERPLEYNDTVIFPDKVRLNLEYYYKRTFWGDLRIIFKTVFYKFV